MCVLFDLTSELLGEARRAHQVVAGAGIQDSHWDALGGRRLSCRRRPGLSLSASAASRLADRARSIWLSRSARGFHLRSHRRGLVQEGALGASLATSRRLVEVPADALALALVFSFALALALLGSRSCGLRLGLCFRLRLSFRLGFRDYLGVVVVRARTPSSARLAVADGEARGLLLLGVRHHERDVRAPVLVDLGDFSELTIRADLLDERQACILQELQILVLVAEGDAIQVGHRRRETRDVLDAVREEDEEVVFRRRSPERQHEVLPHREEGFQRAVT